jgi:hypothetical protein
MELIVDVANVMGSKPDGWWRDRAGAAERLLAMLPPLVGREVRPPSDGGDRDDVRVAIERIVAVVEGQAKRASAPAGIDVVVAAAVGDDEIVAVAERLVGEGRAVLVVTADRGLRARLPDGAGATGPAWLNELIGR